MGQIMLGEVRGVFSKVLLNTLDKTHSFGYLNAQQKKINIFAIILLSCLFIGSLIYYKLNTIKINILNKVEGKAGKVELIKQHLASRNAMPDLTVFGKVSFRLNLQRSLIDDEGLEALLKNHPQLEELDLSNCPHLTGKGIEKLTHLKRLNMNFCKSFQASAVAKFPPSLIYLNLSNNYISSATAFSHLSKLQFLALSGSYLGIPLTFPQNLISLDLEGAVIHRLHLENLPKNLERLNLSTCKEIEDEYLNDLPQSLKYLDLSYCDMITDRVLNDLRHIKNVNLKGCMLTKDDREFKSLGSMPKIGIVA